MSSDAVASPPAWLAQLRANPRLPLMIGASAAVAALAALWLWSRTPDYGVLYSNLSDRDGGAIIASLQQMNIPYKFSEGGSALLIAAEKVPEARLKLAAQGLPKGGTVGFELLDNQKFGTSQFAEQVNYQRGLEGELAKSIMSIGSVSAARVHLALPKPSLFVRDQKHPSASVVLTLQAGRSIDEGQVSAIVHLISSSVPELSAKSITVVDQAGNLLSAANATARGLDTSQLKYAQEIEQGFIRRIEAILQPIVGSGNVHAQASADIDFSVAESTEEKYGPNGDPNRAAIRSQQLSESGQGGGSAAGGVPGALSNQAPAAPQASPAALNTSNRRKDGTTNYEVDRSIRHVQQGAGAIRRLSVAVLVNYRDLPGGKSEPLPAAELAKIENLVKETMGFNSTRGDSVNVVNSRFAVDAAQTLPELPWWRQPETVDLAKGAGKSLMLGVVVLSLLFGVVRPMLRRSAVPPAATPPLAAGEVASPQEGASTAAAPPAVDTTQNQRHQENVRYAQEVATKGPQMVAMLIKHWMDKKDG